MDTRIIAYLLVAAMAIAAICKPITPASAQIKPNSQQQSADLASQLRQDEQALKALQDRGQITPEQAAYLKQLYDSKNDFKTLVEAEEMKLDTKIDANESKFDSKLGQSDALTKAQISQLQTDFSQEEKRLADTEMSIRSNYFTVFGTVLAVISLLAALGGYIMKEIVLRDVSKKANLRINEIIKRADLKTNEMIGRANASITQRMEQTSITESYISIADTCYRIIRPIWENYEKDYLKFLSGEATADKTFFREVRLARLFSWRGLSILRENKIPDGNSQNARVVRIYAGLVNNFVYHETAELLCEGDVLTPEMRTARTNRVIIEADECLKLSKNGLLFAHDRTEWYNLQETAAFSLIKLGDEISQREGRRILAKVFAGYVPGPEFTPAPRGWLAEIWDAYFGSDDGTPQNRLGLGLDPIPPRP
jgi:hypothetical protein